MSYLFVLYKTQFDQAIEIRSGLIGPTGKTPKTFNSSLLILFWHDGGLEGYWDQYGVR